MADFGARRSGLSNMRLPAVLSAFFLLVAMAASAQPVTSFAELPSRVTVGDTVTVDQGGDGTVRGRIMRMAPDALVINANGAEVTLQPSRIRRVSTCCDRLTNGTLIGLAVGGALGVSMGWFSGAFRASDAAQGLLVFGGIGAGLGAGLDALDRRERVVYRVPGLAPLVRVVPGRAEIGLAARW